jgi:hypothetical protein
MPGTYEKIVATTLSSNQTTVTLDSIPQTYTDLVLVVNGKTNGTGGLVAARIRLNGDSNSNYSRTILYGANDEASSGREISITSAPIVLGQAADNFGNAIVNFQNYSNSTTYKTFIARENRSNLVVYTSVQMWRNTNPISSITLTGDGGTSLLINSTFTLYGIKAA